MSSVNEVRPQIPDQGWNRLDPIIPQDLKDEVKVVVFACDAGHKTKATSLQIKEGVKCGVCQGPAKAMPQFLK